MISFVNVVLFGLIFLVSWHLFARKKKQGKQIPGPTGLPLIGSTFSFLGRESYEVINEFSDKYGPILEAKIGTDTNIILSDPDLIKRILQHPNFTVRPPLELFQAFQSEKGILFSSGRSWQEQRRFTLRHLRDFGFGKMNMEGLILEEVDEFLDWLKTQEGRATDVSNKFTLAVINALWTITTGKRFNQGDPKLEKIGSALVAAGKDSSFALLLFLPKLCKLFPETSGWNRVIKALKEPLDLIAEPIAEHRKEFSPELQENPRDFIDAYLGEVERTKDKDSPFYGSNGVEALHSVMKDLFDAGTVTTSVTLTWTVLYLMLHPEIQKKLQDEMERVCGAHRRPSLADRPSLPYVEATISEVLRHSSLVPMGVPHAASEDTMFEGYWIPKGTVFLSNTYHVHHNPKLWDEPHSFKPERFINKEGKLFNRENLIPFMTGRRACLGESLARDQLFLFMTSLFYRFYVVPDPASAKPTMQPVTFLGALAPQKYNIVVKERRS